MNANPVLAYHYWWKCTDDGREAKNDTGKVAESVSYENFRGVYVFSEQSKRRT